MKTLKDFTPEKAAKIPHYQAKAIEGIFDGGRYNAFDLQKATDAVNWNYEQCGYKPPVILVAENPMEQQLLFNYLNANENLRKLALMLYSLKSGDIKDSEDSQLDSQLDSQFGSQLGSQLYSQLRSQLRDQLDRQFYSQLGSQLGSQLHGQLYSQLDSQLRSQLDSQLCSQLRSQLRSQLGKYNNNYLFTLNVYSHCLYAWWSFLRDEFKLPLTINDNFETCFKLQMESGVYSCIFSKQVAVICKYPKLVHQEKSGQFRLHNTKGDAVVWGSLTGVQFDCYYIQGRNVSKELFEKLSSGKYTVEDFATEKDEEVKSACVAYMQEVNGDDFIVNFFRDNLKEVGTYVDKKSDKYLIGTTGGMNVGVYTLFKGTINGTNIAYVRCYCPSTDRMFFLGVSSEQKNAKDAIASLYRIPKKLRPHIKEIHRQGERFSTMFTNEGRALMSILSNDDASDLVGITGKEYFSKIKYEY